MNKNLVETNNLTIGYHNKAGKLIHVLKDISLQIKPGETVGLVGESGCGKSTLGQAMMGYLRPGSQILNGHVHFSDIVLHLNENFNPIIYRSIGKLRKFCDFSNRKIKDSDIGGREH